MARQGWAASSMIHPRARMATFRKTPSPEVTISKMVSTSPAVHPSPRGQHTDSTMLPPLMPEPPSPSSSCGAIRSPWRHPDDEGGQPPPPMPLRSPRPPMARQRWAASSTIHSRARMMSVRKSPSQRWSARHRLSIHHHVVSTPTRRCFHL